MNLHALSFTFTYTHAPNLLIIHISNSGFNSAQLNSHSLWNDGSGSSSDDIPLYFFFNNFPSLRFFSSMDAKKCFIMKSIVQHTHFNLRSETKGQNDPQQQQRMCLWLCLSNRTICKKKTYKYLPWQMNWCVYTYTYVCAPKSAR